MNPANISKMKQINLCIRTALMAFVAFACEEGIDPVHPVEPGPDTAPPTVAILYPVDGLQIRVKEEVTPINIEVEVRDDIEILRISLQLDGTVIAEFDSFKDYRHAMESCTYGSLTSGAHTLTVEATDLSGKTATASSHFEKVQPYTPRSGELFYMPFDGDCLELVSITEAAKTGAPSFAGGKVRQAYAGAPDACLTFRMADMASAPGTEFSATFWYKPDGAPDRSGILTVSPDDEGKADNLKNNRTAGFRLFREGSATSQTVKLNVGDGAADTWFDGGANATFNPETAGWMHIAFTVSAEECVVYFDGEAVCRGVSPGISWEGCDMISIASGAPRFTEWGHLSDNSLYDEMRFFGRALSGQEIRDLMNE
jgi:hypothetical protein